jgi:methyl-galactoside transport system permease protein
MVKGKAKEHNKHQGWDKFLHWVLNNAILVVLLILFVVIVIVDYKFLQIRNIRNILKMASTRTIMALGVGGIIISKGTDLSLGRQVGLAAIISASLLQNVDYVTRMYPDLPALPVILPIVIVMLVTGFISLINGFTVAKLNVDPFIATLGMMVIVYGINCIYVDRPPYGAQPIGNLDERFKVLSQGSFSVLGFDVPYLILFALAVTLIIWVIWNKTKFGKYMYAIGGNKEAAIVSGIPVVKYLLMIYMLAGLLYGLGGALEAARIGSANNNTGNMYELDAISACIVGGLSFDGGIGSVGGVVTGVLIFQVISYGLTYIGVSSYLQYIIKGTIIIAAVAIDAIKNSKKK